MSTNQLFALGCIITIIAMHSNMPEQNFNDPTYFLMTIVASIATLIVVFKLVK